MNHSDGRPRRVILCCATWGLLGALGASHADSGPAKAPLWQGVYVQADTQAWSSGLPVLDIDGPWAQGYRQRSGQQRAYQSVQVQAGVIIAPEWRGRPRPLRLGAVTRADALVASSGEAAQLAYHYQSGSDPAGAGRYNADTRALAWRGAGIALQAPDVHAGPLTLELGLQWLRLSRLRRTGTAGDAAYDGLGGYAYRVALRDDDSRTQAPFMSPAGPSGTGASLSVGLRWAPSRDWSLSLHVDDAWSRLRWRGINSDRATLDTDTLRRSADGSLEYRPLLQGAYSRSTLSASIPLTVKAEAIWHQPDAQWSLQLAQRWGLQQTWLGWQSTGALRWSAAVEPRRGAVRLGVRWAGLNASVMADRLDDAAHVRSLQIGYAWDR